MPETQGQTVPEGDRQEDVRFDPEGVEICGFSRYNIPYKQEVWVSQWAEVDGS